MASLALGVVCFVAALLLSRRETTPRFTRRFVLATALAAAALSAGYVALYLRGGPRIIDATSYYLEARALSEGHLAWPIGDPATATAGRFLVRDTLGGGEHVAVIFPPGYPAVLALGFGLGAPMLIGPLCAFLLTLATAALARGAIPHAHPQREAIVRTAALLSALCGALRYHTADTMSHGLAALCLTAALAFALRLPDAEGRRAWALALGLGAALGLLVATRPVSALVAAVLVLAVSWRALASRRAVFVAIGALPFVALLVAHQRAATGAWLHSSQSLYYAVSDGPEGCFRYGFGQGIGCLHEHGDFVAYNLKSGSYGLREALGTSFRRLWMHAVDPLNGEVPFVLIALPALVLAGRRPRLRVLALALPLFVLAYAPFYFDGNYPGGGARFFADQLPLEHVVCAVFLVEAFARLRPRARPELVGAGFALIAFALQAHGEHVLLREREGGRPMFDPAVVAASPAKRGLLFMPTDHGFGLAFDPDADVRRELRVVRYHADASDWLVWDASGRPPSFRYDFDFESGTATVTPYEPPASDALEIEALWPPLAQIGGYALPLRDARASGGGALAFFPAQGAPSARLDLALPRSVAEAGLDPAQIVRLDAAKGGPTTDVTPRVACSPEGCVLSLSIGQPPTEAARPEVAPGPVTLDVILQRRATGAEASPAGDGRDEVSPRLN